MNITIRVKVDDDQKSPVTALMGQLAGLDLDVIEIFNESDRIKPPRPGTTYRAGDVAAATSGFARGAVQSD